MAENKNQKNSADAVALELTKAVFGYSSKKTEKNFLFFMRGA